MKNVFTWIKPFVKPLLALALVVTLFFSHADSALAARAGRVGGSNFSRPAPTYRAPSRTYQPGGGGYYPGGGGYYPGGGFGFPFLIPIFGFGGGFGGLFSILIFIAIANFIVSAFRRTQEDGEYESVTNPTVSVSRVQVGLLAQARELQSDLNRIALGANTGSSAGLAQVLQETTLSLLRHPEYWAYANSGVQQSQLGSAEVEFNRLALSERSKFSEETLSNVNNQLLRGKERLAIADAGGEMVMAEGEPGEYIIVTLLTASEGKLDLPKVNDTESLRRALSQIGAIPAEKLMGVEVLWTPQAETDTLTSDEVIALYPELRVI